jgi:MoaA/NifB/PqqE/SkfB family radical SAM enzyme
MKRRSLFTLFTLLYIKKTSGPVQLNHFITSKCNAKCHHCFYKNNLNNNNDLSLNAIIKITENLPHLYFLLITGGEPFMRADLAEIIIAYYRNTQVREVSIPTNGFLTDNIFSTMENILNSCPDIDFNLVISLDGPSEIHDRIRGVKGGYKKAVNTFFKLKNLKKNHPQLNISILPTLLPENKDVMLDFLKFVKKELVPDSISVNLLRSGPGAPDLNWISSDTLEKILEWELGELQGGKGLKAKIRSQVHKLRLDLLKRTITEKKYFIPCRAANLMGVLSENGIVYPCELLSCSPGNIRKFDHDFRKVWNSSQINEYRSTILKEKCFCINECFNRINIISNPVFIIKNLLKYKIRI